MTLASEIRSLTHLRSSRNPSCIGTAAHDWWSRRSSISNHNWCSSLRDDGQLEFTRVQATYGIAICVHRLPTDTVRDHRTIDSTVHTMEYNHSVRDAVVYTGIHWCMCNLSAQIMGLNRDSRHNSLRPKNRNNPNLHWKRKIEHLHFESNYRLTRKRRSGWYRNGSFCNGKDPLIRKWSARAMLPWLLQLNSRNDWVGNLREVDNGLRTSQTMETYCMLVVFHRHCCPWLYQQVDNRRNYRRLSPREYICPMKNTWRSRTDR